MPFVRRMTGGGALFHGGDISYSISCSLEEIGGNAPGKSSYLTLCAFLVNTYKKLGLNTDFACRMSDSAVRLPALRRGSPFCFMSVEKYDITLRGRKIGGNAQKRKRNFIMQHGSVPLENRFAQALPFFKTYHASERGETFSLEEALKREMTYSEMARLFSDAFQETFQIDLKEAGTTPGEKERIKLLAKYKYHTADWNLGAGARPRGEVRFDKE